MDSGSRHSDPGMARRERRCNAQGHHRSDRNQNEFLKGSGTMKKTLLLAVMLMAGAAPALAADKQYVLRIDGITCPFCVATSEKALKKIDGVKSISSNLKAGTITICADDEKAKLTDESLAALFREKGFTYRGMEITGACAA
ncbi:MAG TPA: hypothetical protein DEA50_11910 [Parvularcula sp.]|nr:hypothetical protein [Parvularcula sp.]